MNSRLVTALLGGSCVLLAGLCITCGASEPQEQSSEYCELRVVDEASGEGVPLVELTTVNSLRFVTDNAGRVAFNEPGLMDREIYFAITSHGYEAAADGFGYRGVRIVPQAGDTIEIKVRRTMIAERLGRLTGEGLYRDSLLLERSIALEHPHNTGLVAGQDSVQATLYRGKVYWFWGDTLRMSYPLGIFRVAGATTERFDDRVNLRAGIDYQYFVDESGFVRNMMPLEARPEGVVWILSLFTLEDPNGTERLVTWYTRRKGLADEVEQGLAVFNDDEGIFEPVLELPVNEPWRRPSGHPIRWNSEGREWLLFGSPSPNVRVEAKWEAVFDPARYESLTCRSNDDPQQVQRDLDGNLVWRWQNQSPPVDSKQEALWIKSGIIQGHEARFSPANRANEAERIQTHSGTVRWNKYRAKWVMIAGQIDGETSFLGEVWYSEADDPTGPFERAVHVLTHNRQTFYNVCHHDFLDQQEGRWLHFEGTYTRDFSGNLDATPRYNYNQILYRLDLSDPRLNLAPQQAIE